MSLKYRTVRSQMLNKMERQNFGCAKLKYSLQKKKFQIREIEDNSYPFCASVGVINYPISVQCCEDEEPLVLSSPYAFIHFLSCSMENKINRLYSI